MTQERLNSPSQSAFCWYCGRTGRTIYAGLTDRWMHVEGAWDILRCDSCRVYWLSPCPSSEELNKCYPDSYYIREQIPVPTWGKTERVQRFRRAIIGTCCGYRMFLPLSTAKRLAARVAWHVPLVRRTATWNMGARMLSSLAEGTPGRLLDVGCGNGDFLAVMRMLGWSIAGIELDPGAAALAGRALGIHVHAGTLDNAPYEAGSFDAVVSNHVIEHVHDPMGFLERTLRLLRPEGRLVVVTPNGDSLGRRLFGSDWHGLDPPRHLRLLTPEWMERALGSTCLCKRVIVTTTSRTAMTTARRAISVRRTGHFLPLVKPSGFNRIQFACFVLMSHLLNRFVRLGEEIEAVAIRG